MHFFQEKLNSSFERQSSDYASGQARVTPNSRRKTKIVCTIGPPTSTREMIWKLAEAGMNVARLNMSHGDHSSHQKTIDLVKEYNAQFDDKVVAIMLDTKVCLYLRDFCLKAYSSKLFLMNTHEVSHPIFSLSTFFFSCILV